MTPKEEARERRAAGRARRRSSEPRAEQPDDGRSTLSRDAMRLVAAAAARGAAQAIKDRRRDSADEEPDGLEEPTDEVELDEEPAAEQADEQAEPEEEELDPEEEPEPEPEPEPVSRGGLHSLVQSAREVLRDLHGADAEGVSSVSKSANGWIVGLEVVELRRVPDSMDVLATYEVEVDEDGDVLRYERVRRYKRAEADRGGD